MLRNLKICWQINPVCSEKSPTNLHCLSHSEISQPLHKQSSFILYSRDKILQIAEIPQTNTLNISIHQDQLITVSRYSHRGFTNLHVYLMSGISKDVRWGVRPSCEPTQLSPNYSISPDNRRIKLGSCAAIDLCRSVTTCDVSLCWFSEVKDGKQGQRTSSLFCLKRIAEVMKDGERADSDDFIIISCTVINILITLQPSWNPSTLREDVFWTVNDKNESNLIKRALKVCLAPF